MNTVINHTMLLDLFSCNFSKTRRIKVTHELPRRQLCIKKHRSRRMSCSLFGGKEQGVSSWKFSPPKLTLSIRFSNYNNHVASICDNSPPPTCSVCVLSNSLLDFSLYFTAFSPSPSVHPSFWLVSFLLPRFPAAVVFRWMVPTVQDPDLQSGDRLSQCPVVLRPECIPTHSETTNTHTHKVMELLSKH